MLLVEDLSKSFDGVIACKDVSFQLEPGELLLVRGRNGSGKTTLINLLAGAVPSDAGRVHIGGLDVTGTDTIIRARKGLGRSFQWPQLMPEWTTFECVAFAARLRRRGERIDGWPEEILERCGLSDREECAAGLNAGQRKLLDVAMTLACRPVVILLDEPCATLGMPDIQTLIAATEWARLEWGAAILMVEHREEALRWATSAARCRIREMRLGHLLDVADEVAP